MPELFSQVLDLKEKDVFLETEVNDTRYFSISGLPSVLSYGKHPFSITFNDPEGQPLLKNLSNIVFEFVDSRGTVIFSDLIDISELSGAGNGFVWIKKDPLRTADEIADGPAYLYVMGELDGKEIPNEWRGIYNVRSTFVYDIRKDYPNTSPLILKSPIDIQTNFSISESIEFDTGDSVFKRSFINVSLTDLETVGGKIESVELSYNEQKAKTEDYEIITTYPLESGSYETTDQSAKSGLSPLTNTTKIATPKKFRRSTPTRFRLRFLNPAKQLAQYLDENRQGEIVEITSSFITFDSAPFFVEKTDNLLTGSLSVGRAVGKGFTFSGKRSAELSTVDYKGFTSASVGLGPGIMMFSGSVKDDITDDYALGGVGLELVADSSSFFRFRTNPKELDIRANAFFIGSETSQFISGSGGNIEISSSLFHLDPANNVVSISGSITATDGTIGGFTISQDALSGDSFFMSGSATGTELFISSSGFTVNSLGSIIANAGLISNFKLNADRILFGPGGDGELRSSNYDGGPAIAIGQTTTDFEKDVGTGFFASASGYVHLGNPTGSAVKFGDDEILRLVGIISGSDGSAGNPSTKLFLGGKGKLQSHSGSFDYLEVDGTKITSGGGGGISNVVEDTTPQLGGDLDLNSNDITGTGNITIVGNISGSSTSTGSFAQGFIADKLGIGTTNPGQELEVIGEISASSYIYAGDRVYVNNRIGLTQTGTSTLNLGLDSGIDTINYGKDLDVVHNFFGTKISGSSTSTGSFGKIRGGGYVGSSVLGVKNSTANQYGIFVDQNADFNAVQIDNTGNATRGAYIYSNKSSATTELVTILADATDFGQEALFVRNDDADQPTIQVNGGLGVVLNDTAVGVSGSSSSTGSFGRVEATTITAPTLAGDTIIDGNLRTIGDITAENFIVSSSVTNITYQSLSGSTIFGDTLDDTHQFTGSLLVTGSNLTIDSVGGVSGSSTSTGSFGSVIASDLTEDRLTLVGANGQLTDSANFTLPSSNILKITGGSSPELQVVSTSVNAAITIDKKFSYRDAFLRFRTNGVDNWYLGTVDADNYGDGDEFYIGTGTSARKFVINPDASADLLTMTGNLISGSSTSTGSFGSGIFAGNVGINTPNPIQQFVITSTGTNQYLQRWVSSDGATLGGFYEESDTSGRFFVSNASGQIGVQLDTGGDSYFAGGNVGIGSGFAAGATSPDALLELTPGAVGTTSTIGGLSVNDGLKINTTSGRSGVTVVTSNDFLDTSTNAAFQFLYPYDDSSSSNDKTYKAFRIAHGSDITGSGDSFSIDKFGNVITTGDISGSSTSTGSFGRIFSADSANIAGLEYPTADADDGSVFMTNGSGVITLESNVKYVNVKNVETHTLSKGTPVHATGTSGNTPEVVAASASISTKMPATFVLAAQLTAGSEGRAVLTGFLNGIDTSTCTEGNILYVGADGGYTKSKPTGSANLIQNIATVGKVDASNGSIFVNDSGRAVDVPNLPTGKIWVGNDNTVTSSIVYLDEPGAELQVTGSILSTGNISGSSTSTGSFGAGYIDNKLGIGITSPAAKLDIRGDDLFIGNAATDASSRIFFIENAANKNQGFSLLYAGSSNPTLGGQAFTATANTFNIIRHPNDSAGSTVLSIARSDGLSTFSGNVVVGSSLSTSSDTSLMIGDSGDTHLRIGEDSNNNARMSWDASENSLEFHLTDGGVARSNVLVLDSTGFVGIGTATPDAELTVINSADNSDFIRGEKAGGGRVFSVGTDASGHSNLSIRDSSDTQVVFLSGNSSVASRFADVTVADTKTLGTSTFISGIAGDGFRISDGGTDGVSMEIDNIIVRNTLRTHIFQKDVVKATNGVLFVSNSGVISGSTDNLNNTGTITFQDDKSATFSEGDRLLYKDLDEASGAIKSVSFRITGSGVTAESGFTVYGVDSASGSLSDLSGSIGGTAVKISGGTLTLDASSANSPFMDVNASSGSAVVRTGNLAGITSAKFGTLSGFGLWASGSAYLEGAINATSGEIGGYSINATTISSSNNNLILRNTGEITGSTVLFDGGTIGGFELTSTQINDTDDNLILKSSGQITASAAQITGKITAETGTIGGFNIGSDLDASSGTLKLKGASGQLTASAAQITGKITAETGTIGGFNIGTDLDASSGTLKLKGASGQLTASAAQITGKITAETGTIGGFTIDDHSLTTTGVEINDSTQDLFISSSEFKVKHTGEITGSNVLFDGGTIGGFTLSDTEISSSGLLLKSSGQITASNADLSGKVTATSGEIGGFTIGEGAISGDSFFMSGSATGAQLFISSSGFTVSAAGSIIANNGLISNFKLSADRIQFGPGGDGELRSSNYDGGPAIAMGQATDNFTKDFGTGFFASASGYVHLGNPTGSAVKFGDDGILRLIGIISGSDGAGGDATTKLFLGGKGKLQSNSGSFDYLEVDGTKITSGGGGVITALNNQAENRLVTIGSTTTELDGEANLNFDGTTLAVGTSPVANYPLYGQGSGTALVGINSSNSGGDVGFIGREGGTSAMGIFNDHSDSKLRIVNYRAEPIEFSTDRGGTENVAMTILDSGNVGIGTTSPSQKLDVVGDIVIGGASDSRLKFYSSAARAHIAPDQNVEIRFGFSNTSDKIFYHSTTEVAKINGNGITVSSGNVSGSSTSTGSFASGFFADSVGIGTDARSNRALKVVGDVQIGDSSDAADYLFFQHNGTDGRLVSNRGKLKLEAQSSSHLVELVSAGISGSSTSTGSFGALHINGDDVSKIALGTTTPASSPNTRQIFHISSDGSTGISTPLTNTRLFISSVDAGQTYQGSHIGIQVGTSASGSLYFGDKDKADRGQIVWNNFRKEFLFISGSTTVMALANQGGGVVITGDLDVSEDLTVTSTGSFARVTATGNIHATKFVGSGAGLTNLNITAGDMIPAGSDEQIQFNEGGSLGASSTFILDEYGTPDEKLVVSSPLGFEVSVGNISGSSTSTGSFGAVHAADKVRIGLTNDGSPHLLEMKAKTTGGDFILGRQSDDGQAFRVGLDSGDDAFLELGSAGTSNVVVLRADGTSHFNGGDVGIGTTSPSQKLTVAGTVSASAGDGGLELKPSSRDAILTYTDRGTDRWNIWNDQDLSGVNNVLRFDTSLGSSNMVIKQSGEVGIGTTDPSTPLEIAGGNGNDSMTLLRLFNNDANENTEENQTVEIEFKLRGSEGGVVSAKPAGRIVAGKDGVDYFTGGSSTNFQSYLAFHTSTDEVDVEKLRITSDNKISGSATSTGSFGSLVVSDKVQGNLSVGGTVKLVGSTEKLQFGSNDQDGGMTVSSQTMTVGDVEETDAITEIVLKTESVNRLVVTDGSATFTGTVLPNSDNVKALGSSSKRWADVFATQTTIGGLFEANLKTDKIGDNPTGTIVSWREDGLVPCDSNEDELVMGVIKEGKDEPIVLGAEPVLVTGKVDIGDYIVTSDKIGHGKAVKRGYLLKKDLFGKVIAQALEPSDDSDSCLIKCMIRKM